MAWMLDLQSAQRMVGQDATPDKIARLTMLGWSVAAVRGPEVLAIAGIATMWPGRGMAWALISGAPKLPMLHLTRMAARGLDASPHNRIEAYVASGHREGHKWMDLLDFTREGRMSKFVGNDDYDMYARVR